MFGENIIESNKMWLHFPLPKPLQEKASEYLCSASPPFIFFFWYQCEN